MTPPDPGGEERQLLVVTAALLDTGRGIDALARPLTVLAFVGLLAPVVVPVPIASLCALVLAALAGLATVYVGVRVAFDAALFRQLADGIGTLASLDGALTTLDLIPARKAGRPLADRVGGATRWLRRQLMLLAIQTAALVVAGAAGLSHAWLR